MKPFRFSITGGGPLSITDIRELARKVEDLGYTALTISDHLDDQLAPLLALAAAAEVTETIRLTPLVLANDYRNPVVLAREFATLDQISNGRIEVGIGAGWMKTDYEQAGIPYDKPSVRIARLEEAVEILTKAFARQPFSFDGEHYQVHNVEPIPKLVQEAPPFLIAGGRPKILGVAGRHAQIVGINPSLHAGVIDERAGATATPDKTDEKITWIKEAAGERFADIELQTRVHLAMITNDREGVAGAMAAGLGMTTEEAMHSPHALVGTEEECVETLHRWRERWGISYIGMSADAVDTMAPIVAKLAGT